MNKGSVRAIVSCKKHSSDVVLYVDKDDLFDHKEYGSPFKWCCLSSAQFKRASIALCGCKSSPCASKYACERPDRYGLMDADVGSWTIQYDWRAEWKKLDRTRAMNMARSVKEPAR